MRVIKTLLHKLYGFYALTACAIGVLLGSLIVVLTPGVMRRRQVARLGLRTTFLLAGIPIRVAGLDNVPDEPSVAIANHRSYLDGLVAIAALPAHYTAVIKADVGGVPVIGSVLRRVGARFLQREPAAQAGRDTRQLLDALHAGESLCMFPEGTFSVDRALLPFRGGAFFLAARVGVPVVPVVIHGTRRVLPPERILPRPGTVQVFVLEPLQGEGADRDAARELRDRSQGVVSYGLQPDTADSLAPEQVPDYDYYRHVFHDRSLPFAYLDLDLLERNIRTLLARSGGKLLRVDARALLCPDIVARVLRSHIRFRGVKCATANEAVHLVTEWALNDVLVAYPTPQPEAIERVCQVVKDGGEITLTADSTAHLDCLARAAECAEVTLPVCIELDMAPGQQSRGGRRSAVRIADQLLALVEAIDGHTSLCFRGLLAFDTQRVAANGGRRWVLRRMSAGAQRALHRHRRAVLERLQARGYSVGLVNGGGAGGIEFNAADSSITEITVGSALYGPDQSGDNGEDSPPIPAAGFATEIMRQPSGGHYACLGDGHTAADVLDPSTLPHPYLPRGAVLDRLAYVGEAQIPIRYDGHLGLGDPLLMAHASPGEVCERFSRLLLVQRGAVADSVVTYRGLGDRLR